MAPQCPVNLLTLHFKEGGGLVPSHDIAEDQMREPWVYQECGHVFGQHEWKGSSKEDKSGNRTCPICRKVSQLNHSKQVVGNRHIWPHP